jgi:hypothetical protein
MALGRARPRADGLGVEMAEIAEVTEVTGDAQPRSPQPFLFLVVLVHRHDKNEGARMQEYARFFAHTILRCKLFCRRRRIARVQPSAVRRAVDHWDRAQRSRKGARMLAVWRACRSSHRPEVKQHGVYASAWCAPLLARSCPPVAPWLGVLLAP